MRRRILVSLYPDDPIEAAVIEKYEHIFRSRSQRAASMMIRAAFMRAITEIGEGDHPGFAPDIHQPMPDYHHHHDAVGPDTEPMPPMPMPDYQHHHDAVSPDTEPMPPMPEPIDLTPAVEQPMPATDAQSGKRISPLKRVLASAPAVAPPIVEPLPMPVKKSGLPGVEILEVENGDPRPDLPGQNVPLLMW